MVAQKKAPADLVPAAFFKSDDPLPAGAVLS
jgi:hypothetical protein